MGTVTKKKVNKLSQFGGVPYGNAWKDKFHFETNSSGIFVDSDLATAVQVADVVRIGILPAGLEMQDSLNIISDAFTAATTASIGFEYVDGVDVAGAGAQDAAYFASALATSSTGVSRKTGVKAPITLTKEAYLILTIGGAAHAAAGVLDVIVEGIAHGQP